MDFTETRNTSVIAKILFLQKTFIKLSDIELKPYGLTNGLYLYLIYINKHKLTSMADISRRVGKNKAHITRVIQKLESLGYVKKTQDINDLRNFNLILTDKADTILQEIKDLLNIWDSDLHENLEPDEYLQLLKLLKKAIKIKHSSRTFPSYI